ncbi:MAG: rRNA ((1518)-N(6)/adenine(1519)-N(6))-dimethyltransferase RsmA [Pseudomonadota bacterium]|jgi:16S rRNA (adenine1518-N6/adenine1519-N6)-dimethyltransferase
MNNKHKKVDGHAPQKRFGQNFLHDTYIIQSIVSGICKSASSPDDSVIEIGPGLGALTQYLVKNFKQLNVIEIDKHLAEKLPHKFSNINVYQQDVLNFDFTKFSNEQNNKIHVVGNLPYNISSPLLLHLINHIDVVNTQHFMLQKEVIDRMVADNHSKAYGRISILLQAHYTMYKTLDVPPEAFNPPPKVDSAVVYMKPNVQLTKEEAKKLEYITRICFSQRRKMLRGFVENKYIFEEFEFNLSRRAEEVSVSEYINLAKLWAKLEAH